MNRYTSTIIVLIISVFFVNNTNAQVKAKQKVQFNKSYYTSLGATDKVAELMLKLTLDEKIGQLNLITPGGAVTGEVVSKDVESKIKEGKVGGIFGIKGAGKVRQAQSMAVNESRLGIPLIVGMDVIHGHQTIFPIPLGLACSWDMDLIEKTAQIASKEATADGIMWTFSPMVDIARDPRWGRIAEGAGEDPFLGSKIAAAMVKGYQGNKLSDPTTMMACVKHYALYGGAEGGRDYSTVDMSKLRMFNEYLPPYYAAIKADVGSVMTSFNVVDYMPATGNQYLYQDILRKMWGFDGLVVTDYTAINEMIAHGTGDLKEVSAQAMNASVDMDMVGEGFLTTLSESLAEGKVNMKSIDEACIRILNAKEKLGLFDDPYKYFDEQRAQKDILNAENRSFARKAASSSFVLLKNKDKVLPLKKEAKIALIGPLADSKRNMLGTWSVSGDWEKSVSVLEGMKQLSASPMNIKYAKGSNISDNKEFIKRVNAFGEEITVDIKSPEDLLREALALVADADVIVAVVGEAADMSGEASSLTNISIQPEQKKLLKALRRTGKPMVMVLFNGRPMVIQEEMEDMDAILDVWFGGTEAGNAVADVLYGDVNPSGKLTTSFPYNMGQIPVYHSMLNTGRPDPGNRPKFRSNYLDAPNEPLLPFGFGLSYTTFEYGDIQLSQTSFTPSESITAKVTVKNTGKTAGYEVVQMYIRDVVGSISRPVKELKGFEKVYLLPGESKTITFTINEDLLKFYNSEYKLIAEPGEFKVFIGTNSSDVKSASFQLNPAKK
ncbi:MAG: beta-glucosidase BglX [Lewinellaceae bacterium]|nr:beta-glucosidase BglX [Lewinellaceae bacterium]